MRPSDIENIIKEETDSYSRGALAMLSSKHFVFWCCAIRYAFSDKLGSSVSDEVLRQRLETVITVIEDARKAGRPTPEMPDVPLTEMLRRLKRDTKYLSSKRLESGAYEYRVTAAARKAMLAVQTLSEEGNSDFGGARVEMILNQIDAVEKKFQADVSERIAIIDNEIAKLVEERADVLANGVKELDDASKLDELSNLQQIMESLPADVQSVAQRIHDDGESFRERIASQQGTMSSDIAAYDRSNFELLRNSPQGKSYLDAMDVLGSERMYDIQERLEALESSVPNQRATGIVTEAWDDLLRSVEQVERQNHDNVRMLSTYVDRFATARGRRRTETLEQAIIAVNAPCVLVPWTKADIASMPNLNYVSRENASFDMSASTNASADDVDYDRLAELATYNAISVLSEIARANPEMTGKDFVCAMFNDLDKKTRRLVEWGGLVSTLLPLGFVEYELVKWHFVDLGGNEREWIAPDLYGNFSKVQELVRRANA
jgi:hypothetical protein